MQNIMPRLVRNVLVATVVTGISFAAQAADGKVNFTGNILDTACTVSTGTATQTVDLGQIPRSSFSAKGDVAAATRFTIVLDNCPTA
ncbi:fimbrial protein, partial [Enterobacter genomosp. S]|uniref:fimbrial protein n=1 Tax=Enterobacter genomosp. S TaxID=2364151 RepID=UPI000ACBDC13